MPFRSSAAVTADGVYVGSRDKKLYAFDPRTGRRLWEFATRGMVDSSPVVVGDRVFFGSQDGRIYGLDRASGKEVWRYDAGGKIVASPAVAGGRLVIGSDSGHLYCFGRDRNVTPVSFRPVLLAAGGDDAVADAVGLLAGERAFPRAEADAEEKALLARAQPLGVAIGVAILEALQIGAAIAADRGGNPGPAHRLVDHQVQVPRDGGEGGQRHILRDQFGPFNNGRELQLGHDGRTAEIALLLARGAQLPHVAQQLAVQNQPAGGVGVQQRQVGIFGG